MQIGDLAKRAGISLRTIRYYEERGLIEPAARSKGGFRLYEEKELRKLSLIRTLQLLDMPLAQVKSFFDERRRAHVGAEVAPALQHVLRAHLEEIERRLAEYQAARASVLETLDILNACATCPLEPGPAVCLKCPVLTQREAIPVHMQAIINSNESRCSTSDPSAAAAERFREPVAADSPSFPYHP